MPSRGSSPKMVLVATQSLLGCPVAPHRKHGPPPLLAAGWLGPKHLVDLRLDLELRDDGLEEEGVGLLQPKVAAARAEVSVEGADDLQGIVLSPVRSAMIHSL